MGDGELGFGKLLLSSDASVLKQGLEEAKAHARSMGRTMAEIAEEVGGKARRVLLAQESVDRAVIELTGTTTQQQMAAIDQRYGKWLAKARRFGLDSTELERAMATRKSGLLEEAARRDAAAAERGAAERRDVESSGARAVFDLTATETQKRLAAVDQRHADLLARLKAHGMSTTALEAAISRQKSLIWESEAQKAGEAIRARATAESKGAGATNEAAEATRKGGVQLKSFKDLLKVGGTEARSFAGSLGTLATSGFGAAIAGIAIATKLLGAYINKMNESRRENAQFLSDVHKERRGIRDLDAEVTALSEGREDTALDQKKRDIKDLMHELEDLDRQLEVERSLHGPEFAGGGKDEEFEKKKAAAGNKLDIAKRELVLLEKKAALENGRDFDKEIDALHRRNRLERNVLALDEEQEKFKRAHFEIEERYLALLEGVTTEEQKQVFLAEKQLELENLQDRMAREAAERDAKAREEAAKDLEQAGRDRVAAERELRDEVTALEIEMLEENVRLSGGALQDRLALLEAEQAAELKQFDEHHTQLYLDAEERGLKTTALEEGFEVRREQILHQHAEQVKEAHAEAGAAAVEYSEVASSAFEKVVAKVQRARTSLLDLNSAQLELLAVLRKTDMKMTVNDGRPLSAGLSDFEKMARGMQIDPFAGAFVNPGPLMFGPSHGTSGGVKVNITNNGQPMGVKGATARYGVDGSLDIDLIVAEAIRRSGSETESAISETFDVHRSPR